MKYKVVSDRTPFQKGTTFVLDKDVSGIVFDTNNATYPAIGRDMLRQYPEDFEPIEEVQEGQYWKTGASAFPFPDKEVLRIMKTTDNHDFYQSITSNVSGNGEKKVLERHGRKLSTDEIEEAITKEAKRRGFEKNKKVKRFWDSNGHMPRETTLNHVPQHKSHLGTYFNYRTDGDRLICCGTEVYRGGEWAEIIDQTPHIEINGYEAEFHEDYVQFGCAKIDKRIFTELDYSIRQTGGEIYRTGYGGNRALKAFKIGEGLFTIDQIKQIAECYE